MQTKEHSKNNTGAVILAALGYFVDIFDLLLFSIVRKPSLASLGLNEIQQIDVGLFLHNLQMAGMLIGGVVWGVLGDKKGRLSVLYGSIFLYSMGNLANAFVHDIPLYALCRFVSGLGLAGELGAGITLVAETLPKDKRGYGTMIVATVGVSGAVVAGFVSEFFDWRMAYIIGGALGLSLLLLRIQSVESHLFKGLSGTHASNRGRFFSLFTRRERFGRFLNSILIAVPIWFVIGTLIQFAPEFAKQLGVAGEVTAGRAVMYCYAGLVFGDFASGGLSQLIKSRIRVVFIFLFCLCMTVAAYFILGRGSQAYTFYLICAVLGFFSGYWAVFVTLAAEQFGTNMRATVATSAPNFVRASVIPMSLSFKYLKSQTDDMLLAAIVVGTVVLAIALLSNFLLKDTFGKDLDFYEA